MMYHELIQEVSKSHFQDVVNNATQEEYKYAQKMARNIFKTSNKEVARKNAVSLISQAVKPWEVDEWDRKCALIGFCLAAELHFDGFCTIKKILQDAGLNLKIVVTIEEDE